MWFVGPQWGVNIAVEERGRCSEGGLVMKFVATFRGILTI